MEYRTLGRTGLELSVLGFGAAPLGHVFGNIDEDEGVAAVRLAMDEGINYFDTSPAYGKVGPESETVMGRALRGIDRERYVLSTKCGRIRVGGDYFDHSPAAVTEQFEGSLQRLGVDYVDMLFVHDVEWADLDFIANETIPAVAKLKEAGKARCIGFSGYPMKIFTALPPKLAPGTVDVVISHSRYTLQDPTLLSIVDGLEAAGIGVINAAPLSMGLLTEQGPPAWRQISPELGRLCREAMALCKQRGSDIVRLAVQFAVAQPRMASTLVGMIDRRQVRDNVAAATEPVDQALMAQVLALFEPVRGQGWRCGLEENN